MSRTAVLLVDCPDAKGIVASVSTFLYSHGANILGSDQHQDNQAGLFFMRVEFDLTDFTLDPPNFAREFQPIAGRYQMQWRLEDTASRTRVALFVSRHQHCLVDLLHRHQTGELPGGEIAPIRMRDRWLNSTGCRFITFPWMERGNSQPRQNKSACSMGTRST